MAKTDDIEVRILGAGIVPETVDARAALEVAAAYLDLLTRIADEKIGEPLAFQGLQVLPGSLRIVTKTLNPPVALEAAEFSAQLIQGGMRFGFNQTLERLQRAVREFPADVVIESRVDDHVRRIEMARRERPPAYEESTLRAKLIRIGGKRPTARFESPSEERPFTLELSTSLAQRLSTHLYRQVEITFRGKRDEDGCLVEGRLYEFEPVEQTEDPLGVVRDWVDESGNAAYWGEITDLEKDLRGEDD